jgi:hypothetical protein
MTRRPGDFWRDALLTVGVLMTALCGSCTAWYGVALLASALHGETYLIGIAVVGWLLIGGVPTLIGVFLLHAGLRRRRRPRPPPSSPPSP